MYSTSFWMVVVGKRVCFSSWSIRIWSSTWIHILYTCRVNTLMKWSSGSWFCWCWATARAYMCRNVTGFVNIFFSLLTFCLSLKGRLYPITRVGNTWDMLADSKEVTFLEESMLGLQYVHVGSHKDKSQFSQRSGRIHMSMSMSVQGRTNEPC